MRLPKQRVFFTCWTLLARDVIGNGRVRTAAFTFPVCLSLDFENTGIFTGFCYTFCSLLMGMGPINLAFIQLRKGEPTEN